MDHTVHNAIVNFIWNIADDVLRDVYVRGKYRDVILPMTVLRRLDCLLEPTKDEVLKRYEFLEKQKIHDQKDALAVATGYPFYNTSRFTLKRLLDEPSHIDANFRAYLDGFSSNVQEIINKFKLRNQIETLVEADVLFDLIEKFISKKINLSPEPVKDGDGEVIFSELSNLGMGYVFEELIRKFNEENNEEAGEHFTPRDIIKLMAHMVFEPIRDQIKSGTYLVYDPACGSGGMLTEAEKYLHGLASTTNKKVRLELYGQEVNPETFAICQSDMLIKDEDPDNIRFGSTLSKDAFGRMEFDFMMTNPPYGKSWKSDIDSIVEGSGNKKEIIDRRFQIGVPRSSDGQLLFMVNMLSKMKQKTKLGSRIASVHNGSALFTGDAGGGESEIRKWIIENDWLECIIGLPQNMFYNTGIATYIWILTNRKPEHRKGKVQLIDASGWFTKLRKNLGQKNCEFSDNRIDKITQLYLDFEEAKNSKIFENEDFGYHKITVERPLRLSFQVTEDRIKEFRKENPDKIHFLTDVLISLFGEKEFIDFNEVKNKLGNHLKSEKTKISAPQLNKLFKSFTETNEKAEPVIKKKNKDGRIEYEPDSDLRDTENVPLKESIDEFFEREVIPHVPDAWVDSEKTTVGYEISFTKYFYKYQPLRNLDDITKEILELEKQTEGLLHKIIDETQEVA